MIYQVDNNTPVREEKIGVVYWVPGDGIATAISNTLESLGYTVVKFLFDDIIPEDLAVVLVYGPLGSLVPLANQLLSLPAERRPKFVLWMTEQFPNPDLPEWFRYSLGLLRSRFERIAFQKQGGKWQPIQPLVWLTRKGSRYRYYGDIYWLRRIVSVLAITSHWTTDFLRARGFNPALIYFGIPTDWGADLKLKRDIPVLWIGKIGSNRRRRILTHIRATLKSRGIELLMIDGEENPYVFGQERTVLLNRTRIVLNIMREKWDDNSMRYLLAGLNRCLIVSEPTFRHSPFEPGVHLIETPIEQMADVIQYYLSHEEESREIAERAHHLVMTELTMKNAVARVLESVGLSSEEMNAEALYPKLPAGRVRASTASP